MNYKDKFYSKYISTHAREIYGEISLDMIRKQDSIWESYFGRFLPESKDAKIIDIGCGNGGLVYWLKQRGFKNSAGVDISEEQVETAKKLGISNVFRDDFRNFLKDKANHYDLIFARDVLEHFAKEDVLDILKLTYESLKDGGALVAQTVNAENFLWGRLRHGDFTHELAFTKESIRQIMLINGFREVKIFPQWPVIHGVISFLRYFLWRVFEFFLHIYLLVETGSPSGIFTQNLIVMARK